MPLAPETRRRIHFSFATPIGRACGVRPSWEQCGATIAEVLVALLEELAATACGGRLMTPSAWFTFALAARLVSACAVPPALLALELGSAPRLPSVFRRTAWLVRRAIARPRAAHPPY